MGSTKLSVAVLLIAVSFPWQAEAVVNPMHCTNDKTELKRIEIRMTKRVFMVWDKQGKIGPGSPADAWKRANDAAREITMDNFKCKRGR